MSTQVTPDWIGYRKIASKVLRCFLLTHRIYQNVISHKGDIKSSRQTHTPRLMKRQ